MSAERESPASGGADRGLVRTTDRAADLSATSRPTQLRKWQRILQVLAGGRSLNRFEAAREFRDWCLNTTISQLEQRGVRILRVDETVRGAFGPVHCCRYRLDPESAARARELIGAAP